MSWQEQNEPVVVLDVSNLSVAYGAKKAVDNVSLRITRGEIVDSSALTRRARGCSAPSRASSSCRPGPCSWTGIDIQRHPVPLEARMCVELQATSFQARLIKQIARLYAGLYRSSCPTARSSASAPRESWSMEG